MGLVDDTKYVAQVLTNFIPIAIVQIIERFGQINVRHQLVNLGESTLFGRFIVICWHLIFVVLFAFLVCSFLCFRISEYFFSEYFPFGRESYRAEKVSRVCIAANTQTA